MKTLVIIPAYNEEESIIDTVEELKEFIKNQKKYEIDFIVVNDGSIDNTKKVLEENKIPHINHIVNLGVGASIKTGILYAQKNGYQNVTQFDADGQHIPEYIINLIEKIEEGYDVVIGSRFVKKKKELSIRMLGSKILSNLIYYCTKCKIKITDPTSGQRILNYKVMEKYMSETSCSEPNFAIKYFKHNFKIIEIPVTMRDRAKGESYFNLYNSITFMLEQIMAIVFGY